MAEERLRVQGQYSGWIDAKSKDIYWNWKSVKNMG